MPPKGNLNKVVDGVGISINFYTSVRSPGCWQEGEQSTHLQATNYEIMLHSIIHF